MVVDENGFKFDQDPLVDSLAEALLMTFGLDPCAILGRDLVPMSWLPYAREIAGRLRENAVVTTLRLPVVDKD